MAWAIASSLGSTREGALSATPGSRAPGSQALAAAGCSSESFSGDTLPEEVRRQVGRSCARYFVFGQSPPWPPPRAGSSWRVFLRRQAVSALACDFLTVETAFLQRLHVLFFISLATHRVEYIASLKSGWRLGRPAGAQRQQPSACAGVTSSADSSTNTKPPREFATTRLLGSASGPALHAEGARSARRPCCHAHPTAAS